MPKRLYPKHVQKHGNHLTYVLSIAGERVQGGMYHTHTIAALEAEMVKRYVRARYGTKAAAMRPAVPEEDLQAYATERGYNLSYPEILQYLPAWIREMFTDRGEQIGRNLEELEPHPLREILAAEGRKDRQRLKMELEAYKAKLKEERAVIWAKARQDASEAWKQAKIELEGLRKEKLTKTPLGGTPVTREQALAGLGDPATWDAHAKAVYAEFEKKPS